VANVAPMRRSETANREPILYAALGCDFRRIGTAPSMLQFHAAKELGLSMIGLEGWERVADGSLFALGGDEDAGVEN